MERVSWDSDAVVQVRNGAGLDSVVVGSEKWTKQNDSQDVGKNRESRMTPGFGFR